MATRANTGEATRTIDKPSTIDLRTGRNTFADLAYEYVFKAIESHQFRPGDRLRPQDLAAATRLSPTPIKHALARLAGEGLVEFIPGTGPHVAAPSVSEIIELFDARMMCEAYAVQEGFHSADGAFVAQLDTLRRRYEVASAEVARTEEVLLRRFEADRDFHRHLVSVWANRKVQAWYEHLHIHLKAFRLGSVPEYLRPGVLEEHRAIFDAVGRHDVGTAVDAVRRHALAAKEYFLLRVQPDIGDGSKGGRV